MTRMTCFASRLARFTLAALALALSASVWATRLESLPPSTQATLSPADAHLLAEARALRATLDDAPLCAAAQLTAPVGVLIPLTVWRNAQTFIVSGVRQTHVTGRVLLLDQDGQACVVADAHHGESAYRVKKPYQEKNSLPDANFPGEITVQALDAAKENCLVYDDLASGRCEFGYTGHETDRNTGLVYFKARHYDPELGRFISADPYEGEPNTPVSWNSYLYANGNPLFYIDKQGYYSVGEFLNDSMYYAGAGVGALVGAPVGVVKAAYGIGKFVGDAGLAVAGDKGGAERMNERGKAVATLLLQPQLIKEGINSYIDETVSKAAERRKEGNDFAAGFGLGYEGGEAAGPLLVGGVRFPKTAQEVKAIALPSEPLGTGAVTEVKATGAPPSLVLEKQRDLGVGVSPPKGEQTVKAEQSAPTPSSARQESKGFPDSALVVRGGNLANQSAEKINSSIGPSRTEGVTGFSAQCNGGTCLPELGAPLRNKKLGVTTAGEIRATGGDVVPTPGLGNHVTVTNMSGEAASPLFKVEPNPNPKVD